MVHKITGRIQNLITAVGGVYVKIMKSLEIKSFCKGNNRLIVQMTALHCRCWCLKPNHDEKKEIVLRFRIHEYSKGMKCCK